LFTQKLRKTLRKSLWKSQKSAKNLGVRANCTSGWAKHA